MTAGGCIFIEDYFKVYENKEVKNYCDQKFMFNVKNIIEINQPSYVIYSGSFILDAGGGTWFLKNSSETFNDIILVNDFKKNLYKILEKNIVILIYPYPDSPYKTTIRDVHLNELKSKFVDQKVQYLSIDQNYYYKAFNRTREINIYDSIIHKNLIRVKPLDILCKQTEKCLSVVKNKFLFSNADHPTYYGSSLITDEVIKIIESTKLPTNLTNE